MSSGKIREMVAPSDSEAENGGKISKIWEFAKFIRGKRLNKKEKSFKREVRSVFGWTDVPQEENEEEQENEIEEIPHQTFKKQDELPRLPIPTLQETLEKYEESVIPLLSSEEIERTKAAIQEFLESKDGEKCQQKLLEFDQSEVPSWLEPFWDDAYLCGRDPICINVNYFFGFEDDPKPEKNSQITRASGLLHGAIDFFLKIRSETLSVDMERNVPLCMSQYPRIFGASRIPQEHRDKIVTYTKWRPTSRCALSKTTEYSDVDPTHVVVLCNDQYYWFDVIKDRKILPIEDIASCLTFIVNDSNDDGNHPPIGVFTTQNRDYWAKMRTELINCGNLKVLEKIQSALMVVCLDMLVPNSLDEVSRVLLHGPSANRWFDKHQLIVCRNGKAGICFEHSVGDGATTLRLADEMYQYSVQLRNLQDVKTNYGKENVKSINWQLNENIQKGIQESYERFKEQILENETSTLEFSSFGGQFIKQNKMSPDAFVQMAIQLASYQMFGRFVATYEAASTRKFFHGRTETVRTLSNESVAFCESTIHPLLASSPRSNQYDLLKKAVESHVMFMKNAKEGRGVDRHLFGLFKMFEKFGSELGIEQTPQIFRDVAYQRSGHWNLSTSHCGCSSLNLFGFGPVVEDGFGIGYMIKNNTICFNITSKYSYFANSSAVFTTLLESSLLYMKSILFTNPEKMKAPPVSLQFTEPKFVHPTSSAFIKQGKS